APPPIELEVAAQGAREGTGPVRGQRVARELPVGRRRGGLGHRRAAGGRARAESGGRGAGDLVGLVGRRAVEVEGGGGRRRHRAGEAHESGRYEGPDEQERALHSDLPLQLSWMEPETSVPAKL